jgi:hypothetical protein
LEPVLWSQIVVDYIQPSISSLAVVNAQLQLNPAFRKCRIRFRGRIMDSLPQMQMFEFLLEHSAR